MLTDSGFPSFMWGGLLKASAYLKNWTPHKALNMETLFKVLDGEEANLSHLRVNGGRTVVEIKDRTLDAAAWEGKACGYGGRANTTESGTQSLTASWRPELSP